VPPLFYHSDEAAAQHYCQYDYGRAHEYACDERPHWGADGSGWDGRMAQPPPASQLMVRQQQEEPWRQEELMVHCRWQLREAAPPPHMLPRAPPPPPPGWGSGRNACELQQRQRWPPPALLPSPRGPPGWEHGGCGRPPPHPAVLRGGPLSRMPPGWHERPHPDKRRVPPVLPPHACHMFRP
jgi:hypothetical protein